MGESDHIEFYLDDQPQRVQDKIIDALSNGKRVTMSLVLEPTDEHEFEGARVITSARVVRANIDYDGFFAEVVDNNFLAADESESS